MSSVLRIGGWLWSDVTKSISQWLRFKCVVGMRRCRYGDSAVIARGIAKLARCVGEHDSNSDASRHEDAAHDGQQRQRSRQSSGI